jgi:hypothetical protein
MTGSCFTTKLHLLRERSVPIKLPATSPPLTFFMSFEVIFCFRSGSFPTLVRVWSVQFGSLRHGSLLLSSAHHDEAFSGELK